MPAGSLHPSSAPNAALPDVAPTASHTPTDDAVPPVSPLRSLERARRPDCPLPLPDRCWQLFCQGQSASAIARTLGLHRQTVARHITAIHLEVQADRRADRALALSRALAAQHQLQATAWDLLTHAQSQLTTGSPLPADDGSTATSASPLSVGAGPGVRAAEGRAPSLADCARLLALILASAREVARLERLYDRDALARAGDAAPQDTTVRLIIERIDPREAAAPPMAPGQPEPAPDLDPATTAGFAPDRAPVLDLHADPADAPEEVPPIGMTSGMPSRGVPPPPLPPVPAEAPAGQSDPPAAAAPAADPLSPPSPPPPPEPQPGRVSLGDGSSVWGYASPPAPGSAGSERAGERPRPRRVRFGLPVASGYPLG